MATTAKKTTTPRARKPEEPIRYLMQGAKGDFVIEVPASFRLTFGAVNPNGGMNGRDLHCVRVWDGQKLRAVYCDVRGFRDLSIPLARKIERETGSASWTVDSAGNFDGRRNVQIEDGGFEAERPAEVF